jgi:hypothetical protein
VHQVGSKDSGSQNFSFLAFKGKAIGVTQILCITAATARDRRKKKFIAQIMLIIHKKSRKMKISEFFFFIFLDAKQILPSYSICGK